jgi:hypothetical protein
VAIELAEPGKRPFSMKRRPFLLGAEHQERESLSTTIVSITNPHPYGVPVSVILAPPPRRVSFTQLYECSSYTLECPTDNGLEVAQG